MIEKLHFRCFRNEIYEPFIRTYPKLDKKWIVWVHDISAAIEGDIKDPNFQEFLVYLRSKGDFFTSASIDRKYTKKELCSAELLSFWTSMQLDFTAEEAGCEFVTPCKICRGWRVPKNDNLIMNLSQIPKNKDIIDTLSSNELMFSERLKTLVEHHNIKGIELYPVQHWKKVAPSKKWFYVKIHSVIDISNKTVFGSLYSHFMKPMSIEQAPKSSCGHSITCGEYSEFYLNKKSWDGSDVVRSNWIFGSHPEGSVIYPSPQIFISQKFFAILREHNIKGFAVDVAHLV